MNQDPGNTTTVSGRPFPYSGGHRYPINVIKAGIMLFAMCKVSLTKCLDLPVDNFTDQGRQTEVESPN